ncbi:DEAD/DEAH box helicase [Leptospira idonii]|uniref:DEAD-box ATP-dependent RNA helicase RhpA n=1 Tax=Leptospira idonii TaxID=1193500 RepID=A0A4R9M0J8_9LEPT|nr:DEAD/DEAH box helicase [Leptospira idonii]TGN19315.1 DEAD/DEAH box helicase [Leptospira idonii]
MQKITNFLQFGLHPQIQKAIDESGYTSPTPIQTQAIPLLLQTRDLIGCAQTGTGKTAAFALPILHHLTNHRRQLEQKKPRALVLTPTRELAIQVSENFQTYGKYLNLKHSVIFGGVGQSPQVKSLSSGVDILVATPGRLIDLINQKYLKLDSVETFVLDEADRMLDMGFIHAIKKVLNLLPSKRHNLFFSATMPPEVEKIAKSMLVDPVRIEVTPESTTVEKINQSVLFLDKEKKKEVLVSLFQNKDLKKVVVFTKTKHGANKVAELLQKRGISVGIIHGNKSQTARQTSLENFRTGKARALVATDIAARGIDVDGVTHVINYELPNVPESYVHRIGRTARAGAEGVAISFCDREERPLLKDIEKKIGKQIPVDQNYSFPAEQTADKTKKSQPNQGHTKQNHVPSGKKENKPFVKKEEKGQKRENFPSGKKPFRKKASFSNKRFRSDSK